MSKSVMVLIVSIVALSVLVSAGPTLVVLSHAVVPLVVAVGVVVALLRLVWHYTSRY